jgi:hypothetical protein
MTSDMWVYPGDDPTWGHVDMTGYKVVAVDGEIGTVESSIPRAGSACIVVNTGPWILGKSVMLPAGIIERVDSDAEKIHVARTREQVKRAPEYDPSRADDSGYREELGRHYLR